MVTKHNINYKKYLKLNFYIMDLFYVSYGSSVMVMVQAPQR